MVVAVLALESPASNHWCGAGMTCYGFARQRVQIGFDPSVYIWVVCLGKSLRRYGPEHRVGFVPQVFEPSGCSSVWQSF
jgi:hypothetical protein